HLPGGAVRGAAARARRLRHPAVSRDVHADGAAVQLLVRLHLLPGLCAGRLAGRDRRQRVDLRRRQRHVLVHQPGGHDAGGQLLDGGAWGQAAGQGEDLPAAECRPVRRLRRSADAGHLRRQHSAWRRVTEGRPVQS
uniref:Transferred entry: 7.1.1.9 n=1 Tax=Macrostomum lignano TaxID=282301 RepID=A0A1I8GZB4_9PLAT